jgi:stage II sporulation protein GA (sporulation sigma-E factor processing peptidase)
MVVYVEYVFLDNLIIDALLITLARKVLKLEIKKLYVFLSALFGSVVAVVTPLFKLSLAWSFTLKMPIGLIMVLLSGKFKTVKEFVYCFYTFLFFTFLSGGCLLAVFWGLGLSFDPINYVHNQEVSFGLSILSIYILYRLVKRVIVKIYKKKEINNFTVKCQIQIDGKQFEFVGFFDSGNSLYYRKGDCPIVLCSKEVYERLKKEGVLERTQEDVISVNTVSGRCYVPIYKTQKFLIYNGLIPNILYNVMIGVTSGNFHVDKEYDLLLGLSMLS